MRFSREDAKPVGERLEISSEHAELAYTLVFEPSHSHRGFSPVTTRLTLETQNRFNGLLLN